MGGAFPFIVAPRPQPGPARCAGLRHALLHDWQQGFPVEASPFQVVARRLGGSVREVMAHCHALGEEGALAGIRIHWAATLRRVHWRCVIVPRPRRPAELAACLGALPGVTGWEEIAPVDADRDAALPALWFDLHARDVASAQSQLSWLEKRHGPVLRLAMHASSVQAEAPCDCERSGGPCADPVLARRCEQGLPLVTHPYRALSRELGRSEREVMAALRRWQHGGSVESVSLGTNGPCAESLWTALALGGGPLAAPQRQALCGRPGVAEVLSLPPHDALPWRALLAAPGASPQVAQRLQAAVAAAGEGARPRVAMHLRRVRLREAPRLFAGVAPA